MDDPENHLTILVAKAVVLEQLIWALLKEKFLTAVDPMGAASDYAEQMKHRMEQRMRGGSDDPATMLVIENIDLLFDTLIRELKSIQE